MRQSNWRIYESNKRATKLMLNQSQCLNLNWPRGRVAAQTDLVSKVHWFLIFPPKSSRGYSFCSFYSAKHIATHCNLCSPSNENGLNHRPRKSKPSAPLLVMNHGVSPLQIIRWLEGLPLRICLILKNTSKAKTNCSCYKNKWGEWIKQQWAAEEKQQSIDRGVKPNNKKWTRNW